MPVTQDDLVDAASRMNSSVSSADVEKHEVSACATVFACQPSPSYCMKYLQYCASFSACARAISAPARVPGCASSSPARRSLSARPSAAGMAPRVWIDVKLALVS
jgi:hypothetical protein